MINTRLTLPSGAYADTYIMDSEINYCEYRKRPAILVAPRMPFMRQRKVNRWLFNSCKWGIRYLF